MSRIFISHSSMDGGQATRLLAWLHDQGFTSTFLDFDKHHGIEAGADWERTLYRELSSADAVILIVTKHWFGSKWCFAEFAQARALGKAIFPLIESPAGETFVSQDIQHLDLVKDREGGLDRLLSELTRIALNTRGGYAWDTKRPPYPGLLAFDEADAAIYFGRDDDTRRLIERLNARRVQGGEKLVVVLGASGSGKSSLLRAGVVPRLKRDHHNWIVLPPFRPQLQPLDELAQVISAGLGKATEWRRWRDALAGDDFEEALAELWRDFRAEHKATEAHILLVIDQGEELFASSDAKNADQFFRVLNALLDEKLPFLAVMSLRSDYLGRLQQEPRLEARFEQFSLKPMPLERVREIIEGPAKVAGIAVDDGLGTAAIADAHTEDALPLLAFALRELYDGFASSGRLTVAAYRALGDSRAQLSPLENAVRRKAEDVLAAAKPSAEDLQALKEAFIPAMVRVNAEGEYVRRPAAIESIPSKALPLIERLANARLLTIHEERGTSLVEVAHEALLRKWPLLHGWLDEEREFLVGKSQLEHDLLDWQNAAPEQKSETLLTGLKLTRARLWLLTQPYQLTAQEREFILASIHRQEADVAMRERARRRVLRATIAAAAVLAIVAIAAAWGWWQARVEENQAVSRQLAMQSMQDSASDLGTALREALSAGERAHTSEAETALNAALGNPRERSILNHKSSINGARYSHDGRRIVTTCSNVAFVWDAQDGHLLFTLTGHTNIIGSASFSPDDSRIVTASIDKTARVWDAADGHLLFTLTGHTDAVTFVAFSPDSKRIVTSSQDDTARVWDAGDGHLLFALVGHTGAVYSAVFSPDSKRIVTASTDDTARLWDAVDGHPLFALTGHTGGVNFATFSPDGNRIVTASSDKTARVWDAADGRSLFTLTGHTKEIWAAAFSPDSKRIVTAGADNEAREWDAGNGQLLATLTGHTDQVNTASFSPDGNHIVTASTDQTARLWSPADGRLQATLAGHTGIVWTAVFSPDGKRVATASEDGTAREWDVQDELLLVTLAGHSGRTWSAAFSHDGRRIVTGENDNTARIWDSGSGQMLFTLTGHTDSINSAVFSPDDSRIVTASSDQTARLWDAANGHLLFTLTGHSSRLQSAAFSPDGNRIVTASWDNTARIWNAGDGHLLFTLAGHTESVNSADFSPDGKRVVTASVDKTARVWDAESGHLLLTLAAGNIGSVSAAVFSPDSKRIATASADGTGRVWDAETGQLLSKLEGHTSVINSVAYSPDGNRIVTASWDHTARVWDAATGHLLFALAGHTYWVNSAVFSPDSKRIVSASFDNTARLWNTADGHLLAVYAGDTNWVITAGFSPDSKRVVTASLDGTAKIYLVDFDQLLAQAKQLLPVSSGN
jgi:WD40 repeat protein